MIKLLVIGHTVFDHIYYPDDFQIKPGGIFHTVNGLINIKNNEDEIFLLTSVNKKEYGYFKSVYDEIDLTYSDVIENIPTVTLHVHNNKERDECYSHVNNKLIKSPEIKFGNFSGILINMISGYDINLDDLQFIRNNFNGLIYFDLHTLSRDINHKGKREFRVLPNAEEWLRNIDILQMNEHESKTVFGEMDEENIIEKIFSFNIKTVIITKGKNGVTMYRHGGNRIHENGINVDAINRVGCGDVFGSAFFYSYIKTNDEQYSLKFANLAAGISTTYSSIEDFKKLKNDIAKRIN